MTLTPHLAPPHPNVQRSLEVLDRAAASYEGTRADHQALSGAIQFLAYEFQRMERLITKLTAEAKEPDEREDETKKDETKAVDPLLAAEAVGRVDDSLAEEAAAVAEENLVVVDPLLVAEAEGAEMERIAQADHAAAERRAAQRQQSQAPQV